MEKEVEFKNQKGEVLKGVVHIPKKYKNALLVLHGFPSSMNSFPRRTCRALAKRGFLCMRFNFSGVDSSEGNFYDKRMSQEVKEIRYAINFLEKNYSYLRLSVLGHSTGAIDAALYAPRDKRISRLVLVGMIHDLKKAAHIDFSDEQVRNFWTQGFIRYNWPGKWVNRKKLGKQFYDEFFTLNVPLAMKKFTKPLLIIHGEKDEAIPEKCPRELYKVAARPKRMIVIPGAKHSFKGPLHWQRLVYEIEQFIWR